MVKTYLLAAIGLLGFMPGYSQMHIAGNFSIGAGGTVAVAADVSADADVGGSGWLLLNATSAAQSLDMNDHTVPKLEVNNVTGALLASGLHIGDSLRFTAGHIMLGNSDLVFASAGTYAGADATRYLVTNDAGVVTKQSMNTGTNFAFPVGSGNGPDDFTPAAITNNSGARDINVQVRPYAQSGAIEHNVSSGIDRTWQISSDIAGPAEIALTHNATTAGSSFNANAAFVTQQATADGTSWSVGTPGPGTGGGLVHTGTFDIPAGIGATAYFSKSSDAVVSLPVGSITLESGQISLLPNPFTENAGLQINSSAEGDARFQINDIAGKSVRAGNIAVAKGTAYYPLPVHNLTPGAYTLHVTGVAGNKFMTIIKK